MKQGLARFAKGLIPATLAALLAATAAEAGTPLKFTLDWKYEGPAAPYLIAIEKGYYAAEGLDVTLDTGSNSVETIGRVASGAYDIGFGDINSLIKFRDQNPGADVKAFMMIYDIPSFAIVGRKSLGVTSWQDLVGKKVGAPPPDGAFAQWPAFAKVNNIDTSKVQLESIGFPVREPMLAKGDVAAVFGFSFSVYISLKAAGVPDSDITTILMAKNGLDLYGNALMVNPKLAAEKPEIVKAFARATIKGFKDAVADPAKAAEYIVAKNPVAKKDVELERLNMALADNIVTPYVQKEGFGGVDMARLSKSIEQIGLSYTFKGTVKAEDVFTPAFLPPKAERMLR